MVQMEFRKMPEFITIILWSILVAPVDEYVSAVVTERSKTRKENAKSKIRLGPSQAELDSDQDKEYRSIQSVSPGENLVKIYTIYDLCDNLVHIKFDKTTPVPRDVLQIIGLIVKFQLYLTTLTISNGLNVYNIHELCKIIKSSHITDLCLDNTFLGNSNIYVLLEIPNKIRYLSLSRCKINDDILKKIAETLTITSPSSNSLAILNLSSNLITDVGVKRLAEALRSNRRLVYLNLADNMITDDGAIAILDIMMEFPMTSSELIDFRRRHMMYLKEKQNMIAKFYTELKSGESKSIKKKQPRPSSVPNKRIKGIEKELSLKCLADANRSITNLDMMFMEKAEMMAETSLGGFSDPFVNVNTVAKDGIVYCCGNNSLCYLNCSYNNLSYHTLKRLLNVLLYQKLMDRKPRGMINLVIEGNYLPASCKELVQIDELLQMGLMAQNRRFSTARKKPMLKSGK